ncbi:MAG: response regulator, partial [Alphaproteobacteria bacterium]|nr:response regulator [Alphaproteobacteria bacterium]
MTTIVYIEDEHDIREDVTDELQEAGYRVVEAANAQEGLAAIRAEKPDLVLCDISMPGMSGLELLSRLRDKESRFDDLPFIFLSALADRNDILAGKRLGADDYLTKPVDMELLLATIEARLGQIRRIENKKNRQFVKLYTALTGRKLPVDASNIADFVEEAKADRPVLQVFIVADGKMDLSSVRSILESGGHAVHILKGGRDFMSRLDRGAAVDVVLVSYFTEDFAAPLLLKLIQDTYHLECPVMLLLPDDLKKTVREEQKS